MNAKDLKMSVEHEPEAFRLDQDPGHGHLTPHGEGPCSVSWQELREAEVETTWEATPAQPGGDNGWAEWARLVYKDEVTAVVLHGYTKQVGTNKHEERAEALVAYAFNTQAR